MNDVFYAMLRKALGAFWEFNTSVYLKGDQARSRCLEIFVCS